MDSGLTAVTGVLASVSLEESREIQRDEMIDISDRREAMIWPIKACLQPTDSLRHMPDQSYSEHTCDTPIHPHTVYINSSLNLRWATELCV